MKRLFVLLIALYSGVANAEVRSIEGVPFLVDSIGETGDGNLKVEIGDSSRLIPESMLDDYILLYYFDRGHVDALQINSIRAFIKNSLKSGHNNKAVLGCKGFFAHPSYTSADGLSFFKSFPQDKGTIDFYEKVLLADDGMDKSPSVLAWMLYQVAMSDIRWPKINVPEKISKLNPVLRRVVESEYKRAFEKADYAEVKKVTAVEALFFGDSDEEHITRLRINDKIDEALNSLKQGSNSGLTALIQMMRADGDLNKLMAPLVINLIHQFAEGALQEGHYDQAVNALSSIDPNWRTEVTHKLLLETLRKIIDTNSVVLANVEAHAFLAEISKKDPELEKVYFEYLDFLFDSYCNQKEFSRTQDVLNYFLAVRPDPNKENDVLRAKQISFMLGSPELKQYIPLKLNEVQTSVPLGYFIKFFFSGVYIELPKLLAIFVFLIATLYVLFSHRKGSAPKVEGPVLQSDIDDQAEAQVSNTMSDRPFFVDNRISAANLRANPMMQEYCMLLDKFKLPRDASIKDVKSAYRTIVKKFHPDMHPNQSEEEKNYFVEMTEAYEKVLDIRKKLGLPE